MDIQTDWPLVLWVILTAVIWFRGWKWMALIPFGLGILFGLIAGLFEIPMTQQLMANVGIGLIFICLAMLVYCPKK